MEGSQEFPNDNSQEQNGSRTDGLVDTVAAVTGNSSSPLHLKGEISDIETDDEVDVQIPSFRNRRSSSGTTQRLVKEGSAAAVRAAESSQVTDSFLSFDGQEEEEEEEEEGDNQSDERDSFVPSQPPPNFEDFRRMSTATFNYISSAGVEHSFSPEHPPIIDEEERESGEVKVGPDESFAEISHSWDTDGVLVESKLSESSIDNIVSMEDSFSEQGIFQEFENQDATTHRPLSEASRAESSPIDLLNDDLSVDSASSLGGGSSTVPPTSKSAREILLSAGILHEEDMNSLKYLRQQASRGEVDDTADEDALLIYHLFLGLTTPTISLGSINSILELERNHDYSACKSDDDSVPLPKDCVINVIEKSKVLSIILCRNHQALLQLPQVFFLALFRILIRLLTNESDHEYNQKSLLTCEWNEIDGDVRINQDFTHELGPSDSNSSPLETSRLRTHSSASIGSDSSDIKAGKSFARTLSLSEDGNTGYDSQKANRIYTMIRLQQSGTSTDDSHIEDETYTARKLLRLFDLIKSQKSHSYLLAPISRILGLVCTAGISERVLLRLLALASSPVDTANQVPPVARLLLVRALQTATDGASHAFLTMGKANIPNFFSFGGGKGLSRTISGLTSWPFRNDFGMAVWFRAETFQKYDLKHPVLLSVRAEDGGGIEITLMPLEKDIHDGDSAPSAAALVVSVFDSVPDTAKAGVKVQQLRVPGCILLPRVWYHVAVRHTRSRLKGVFSLSTRQQMSVMLDGKVMFTESLNFPKVSDEDFHSDNKATAFLQKAVRRSTNRTGLSLTVTLGDQFNGQCGSLYLFHENVSEATFRAIYEVNAGTAGTVKKVTDNNNSWDSRRGDIVRKSRILDVGIKRDDAEDLVLSQRRHSAGELLAGSSPSSGALAVMDFGDGDDPELEELPLELSKSAFASKLFLVWDPSRTVANMVLELHIGAHVKLADGGVQSWQIKGPQDVISSIGGIQALIPLFRTLLCGDVERNWLDMHCENEKSNEGPERSSHGASGLEMAKLWSMIPDLLLLVASFVQNHGENARELLRCGGIDVIENFILASRNVATNKSRSERGSLFRPLTVYPSLSRLLVHSIVRLLTACSHYIGLETKVFARLLFNLPLWFSGVSEILGVSLDITLLPCLSTIARNNKHKVRDCVGTRDMVVLLKEYVNTGDCETSGRGKDSVDRLGMMKANWLGPLSLPERRHICDIVLGMIFEILGSGTTPRHLSPFLDLLSYCLDSEWDESSQEMGEKNQIARSGPRNERYLLAVKGCSIFLFLLQIKPPIPNLVVSFAHCCGSVEEGAGWILCSMVNSFDDTIRGLGVRCLSSYMEITATSPDSPLSIGNQEVEAKGSSTGDRPSSNQRKIQSGRLALLAVGKGLAAMGPAGVRSIVLPPSKMTARVIYKLLWHLLKGHRSRNGTKTHSSLLYLAVDDVGVSSSSLTSMDFLLDKFIVPDDVLPGGFRINNDYTQSLLEDTSVTPGRTVREGLGISTVIRLLRYLSSDFKDQLLADILKLAKNDRSSVKILSSLPDWQPCLFHLISETIESFDSGRAKSSSNDLYSLEARSRRLDASNETEGTFPSGTLDSALTVEQRLDLCLDIYATLLGNCIREGGDRALHAVEEAASLQRVCLNGQDVFSLLLSRLISNLCEYGTILDRGGENKNDNEALLKKSARLVTDAILSSGTEGLDMNSAVRCWRSLRHLTAVTVSIVTRSGFGVSQLFDYRNFQASAVDELSGGLHGIRLADTGCPSISALEYRRYVEATGAASLAPDVKEREIYRRVCVNLASQVLSLLDAFIFPDSLDASLPASQLHGLDLVRNCESKFATQGPLIASAIRLSLLLLCHLEPCGVKLLQCSSRLRCLLHWALELIREATALEGYSAAFHNLTAPLDRLVLSIVLQCHRTLGRCSALLCEVESSSYEKYFQNKDSQKKYYRRILRVALELRDVVSTAFRGRNEVLRAALSMQSYEALRESLENPSASNKNASKESLVRAFLFDRWVAGFQDVVWRGSVAIPEQVELGNTGIPTGSQQLNSSTQGFLAIQELTYESKSILDDFERALNSSFEKYLQAQRKWAETDLVRDLEYRGDETVKRLSAKHKVDLNEASRAIVLRSSGAESRWHAIQRKVSEPWNRGIHWKLAKHTDPLGQRILFVRNRNFDSHEEASYDLMLGKEREKEERAREARLRQKEELAEVMRRNTEAIVPYHAAEFAFGDEDEMVHVQDSDTESSVEVTEPVDDDEGVDLLEADRISDEPPPEEEWDKIEAEELEDDAWAKAFIWSDFESVVARFDLVTIVTLQTLIEGKLLLTTHGLYFHQISDEISVMSKEAISGAENNTACTAYGNDRRWRLSRLTEVLGRRYMLRAQALELFFCDSHELFLNFSGGTKERDRFYAKLRNSCKVPMLRSTKSLSPRIVFKKSRLTELWKTRKISNFEYIMELNKMAGRTFNDIMQYPVFPWILADYTSDSIDLNDSRIYRDLTKPIGALNPNRLAQLLERYNDFADFGLPDSEKFLYGSHYSSPGVVLHYLIRQEPFTSMAIELQSGRFDCPDRLFFDVAKSWEGCLTSSSDMKELVPEFFTLPEMFLNTNDFPLGKTQTGRPIDNVGLPPWAKGCPYEFVRIHRLALESEYVSQNLNHWIDLIFGYKQRGPEAEAAHNVFHYLSYEGAVDLDKIVDEVDRAAAESQIQNFGQTPSQLLVKAAHPYRYGNEECWKPLIYESSVSKRLRCYTPSKQFAVRKNAQAQRSSAVKIHVFSDSIAVIYADLSVGTYKWAPFSKRGRLKPDKLRQLGRSELSRSQNVIKRGAAIPQSATAGKGNVGVGNWSFAFTLGGSAKEELRQRAVMAPSRLITTKADSLVTAESSGYLISCGFWDNVIKVHALSGYRLLGGDNGGHSGPIRCLAVAEDGGLMLTGGQDCTCRIWIMDHPDMAMALSDGYVQTALGSTNDGDQLLSCCRVLWGHETPISCLDLSSDLDVAVSGSLGGIVCVHSLRLGEYVRSFRPPLLSKKASGVSKLALHRYGKLIIHMEDFGLHTYTVNGVLLCSKNAGERLHDMHICSNGEVVVTGGDKCHVLIRSVSNLETLSMLDLSRHGPIRCISMTSEDLNPIPQVMFIGSDDGMVTIVDEDPEAYTGAENTDTMTF